MVNATPEIDINAMPVGRRIELIADLWNSLSSQAQATPLTAEQSAEVRHRLAKLNAGESALSPLEDVRHRLTNR